MGLSDDLNMILNRNLIFPEDQLKLINLVKNGSLVKNRDGSISLGMIEERNLIFPDDVLKLRAFINTINKSEPELKTFLGLTISALNPEPAVAQTFETVNLPMKPVTRGIPEIKQTKTLPTDEPKRATIKHETFDGYVDDPVNYSNKYDNNQENAIVYMKTNNYAKIYPNYFHSSSITGHDILSVICEVSQFKKNHPSGYGYRLYFDGQTLNKNQINNKIKQVDKIGDAYHAKEDSKLRVQFEDKKTDCMKEKLDEWGKLFESKNTTEVVQGLLRELNDLDFVELVRIDMKSPDSESFGQAMDSDAGYDKRIVSPLRGIGKEKEQDDFFSYILSMVGGGNGESEQRKYIDAKKKYVYHRDKVIHGLISSNH